MNIGQKRLDLLQTAIKKVVEAQTAIDALSIKIADERWMDIDTADSMLRKALVRLQTAEIKTKRLQDGNN